MKCLLLLISTMLLSIVSHAESICGDQAVLLAKSIAQIDMGPKFREDRVYIEDLGEYEWDWISHKVTVSKRRFKFTYGEDVESYTYEIHLYTNKFNGSICQLKEVIAEVVD